MNEDATLANVVDGRPVAWGLTCAGLCDCCGWGWPMLFASSKSVGARGRGGGDGALGTPNGLREPVWCDLTGIGGGEDGFVWARGVDAGRAGGINVDVRVGIVVLGMFGEAG
jgi:hypothetical protein